MSETKTVEVVEATEVEVKEEQPVEATPEIPVEEVKPTETTVENDTTTFKDVLKACGSLLKTAWSWKPVKVVTGVAAGVAAGAVALCAVSKMAENKEIEAEAARRLESGEEPNVGTSDGSVDIPTTVSTENYVETTAE